MTLKGRSGFTTSRIMLSTLKEDMLAEASGPQSPEDIPHLAALLTETAERHANNIAITSCYQSSGFLSVVGESSADSSGYLSWTFSQLFQASSHFASRLLAQGVRPGTPIVSMLFNGAEWTISFWAAVLIGCPYVPLNVKSIGNETELRHMLDKAAAGVLLVADVALAEEVERIVPAQVAAISIRIVASPERELPCSWSSFDAVYTTTELGGDTKPSALVTARSKDEPVLMLFTSGSTALPKMCPISSTNILAGALRVEHTRCLTPTNSLLGHLPLFHAFGIVWVLGFWVAGASVVFPGLTFSAAGTLDVIQRERTTHAAAVPTMVQALIQEHHLDEPEKRRDISSLYSLDIGAAVVTKALLDRVERDLGLKAAFSCFGTTETSWILAHNTSRGQPKEEVQASVGKATLYSHVKVCAFGDGNRTPLQRGQLGELHLGGPAVIKGYADVATQAFYDVTDANGVSCQWFVTGDQAMMDSQGSIFIMGRYVILVADMLAISLSKQMSATESFANARLLSQIQGSHNTWWGEYFACCHRRASRQT